MSARSGEFFWRGFWAPPLAHKDPPGGYAPGAVVTAACRVYTPCRTVVARAHKLGAPQALAQSMGLVSAFRQSIYLSKHNGLTPTQIAQEWPAAVELQALECETPRIVAALSSRMRKQLLIMLALKIVFYAADLANPWLVGLVSLEYVEPSKYYALITAVFLGCRLVMFSCQGLGDMTARLCGVAAMSSMTRWVFDRMMVLPLGLVNPGMITNLCVTEARAVSMGTRDRAGEPSRRRAC